GRGFASQVWEISYRFMLCAGQPASLLLDKNPLDIVQDCATRAFMPYHRTKDEEEQGATGGALDGDEDDASHSRLNLRGIPAAYRAAREPGDEAE
ncbi:unnamed protein product, partial [Ascophyllum nodosum]